MIRVLRQIGMLCAKDLRIESRNGITGPSGLGRGFQTKSTGYANMRPAA